MDGGSQSTQTINLCTEKLRHTGWDWLQQDCPTSPTTLQSHTHSTFQAVPRITVTPAGLGGGTVEMA